LISLVSAPPGGERSERVSDKLKNAFHGLLPAVLGRIADG